MSKAPVPAPVPPKGPATNLRPAGAHKNPKKDKPRSEAKIKLAALLAEIAEGP